MSYRKSKKDLRFASFTLFSWIFLFSASICNASNSSIFNLKETAMPHSYTRKIDFGFVLLSDEGNLGVMRQIFKVMQALPVEPEKDSENIRGSYKNVPVTIPHISLGQYGCLALELDNLKAIVNRIADKYSIIEEDMKDYLTLTENNIFWETLNTKEQTNPILKNLYIDFREAYFKSIATKHPIAQALYKKSLNAHNAKELELIEKYYQNWGTPEDNRINPHFTFIYSCSSSKEALEALIRDYKISAQGERKITFNKLGLLEIDFWGNPIKLMHEIYLKPLL